MTSYQQTDPTLQEHFPPTQGSSGQSDDASMKDKAAEAVDQGRQAAGQVAQSATERVQEVTHEAAKQARDLVGEARQNVTRQVGEQHRNLAGNLRSLSSELGSMVSQSDQSGTATQLVSQARDRVDGLAGWLENREPGDVLDEVKNFARRRPGTFLLGALAAGVVVGRLTRGAIAAHTDDDGSSQQSSALASSTDSSATTVLPEGGYAHTTGTDALDVPAAPTPGYSTGGGYAQPSGYERPGPEQGYGATSTYGEGGTAAYPSGDYPGSSGYPNGEQR
jgi:hypothetical protein